MSINSARLVVAGIGTTGGRTLSLTGDIVAAATSIIWNSSEPAVATVTKIGSGTSAKVVGIKDGTAIISVFVTAATGAVETDSINILVSTKETTANETTAITIDGLEFFTDESAVLAYALTKGGLEIRANPDGNGWLKTSFNNASGKSRGWYYDLNGRGMVKDQSNNAPNADTTGYDETDPNSAIFMLNGVQQDIRNGVTLRAEPMLITVDDIPYILVVHTLTNTSETAVTEQKFGVYSDVKLGERDDTPIRILPDDGPGAGNVLLTSPDPLKPYKIELVCKTGEPVTPVTTTWIGVPQQGTLNNEKNRYGWHYIYENANPDNLQADGSLVKKGSGYYDSAFAFSYQDINLEPGESRLFLIRFTLTMDTSAAEPNDE